MPMRGGGHMNDIDILAFKDFAEVVIAFHVGATCFQRFCEMSFIHIANCEEFAGGVNGGDVAHSHTADADNGAG